MRRPIATLDCETDPFQRGRVPRPFIWGFFDDGFMDPEQPFYYFTDTQKLVDFLTDKEFIVYAHNGGKFDYHYMLDHVTLFDEVSIINGRLAKFNIGICEFRDSWNILPVPLAAYKKQKFDYNLLEVQNRHLPENWAKIVAYLESDCRNLFEVVDKFIDRFGVQLTQAGAAMRYWTKHYGGKAPRSSASYYETLRPYYYGGRCEGFKYGVIERPFSVVDMNSAYPHAMLQRHAYGLDYDWVSGPEARHCLENLDYEAIAGSFFKVRTVSRGAFPYRDDDRSLIFPNDRTIREYTVTGWELAAAVETGTLAGLVKTRTKAKAKEERSPNAEKIREAAMVGAFEVVEVYTFDKRVSFSDYIYEFYNERKLAKRNGDKANDLFCKLMMNSLYGKFAANPEEYRSFLVLDLNCFGDIDEGIEYEDRIYEFAGFFGPHVLASAPLEDEAQRYYNVATSASITGFVRAELWRAICGSQGVLYCDTDSIAAVNPRVPMGGELGEWTHEGDFSLAAIAGRKLYAFRYTKPKMGRRWKKAHKGVKLQAQQIVRIAQGETIEYSPKVPTYSIRAKPTFVPRTIKMLDKNVTKIAKENL